MSRIDEWLHKAYGAQDQEGLRQVYDQWADHYDADMLETGYLHYAVMAGLVARFVPERNAEILDAGVGTGAFGNVLSILGYNNLHGLDMSEAMLARAAAREVYAGLVNGVLGEKLSYSDQQFAAIVSTGTFTTGHAPARAFSELARVLRPGGVLLFTAGTKVWHEAGFEDALQALQREGVMEPVEVTPVYHPMPHSKTESGFTTRAHVWRKEA
jgi:ubiquinone/menaquinone biosynthesis C-methylase UbiE